MILMLLLDIERLNNMANKKIDYKIACMVSPDFVKMSIHVEINMKKMYTNIRRLSTTCSFSNFIPLRFFF